MKITKDVLRRLNAAIGKLDTDTGQVFAGFVGRLDMADGLYHGDLRYDDCGEDAPQDTVTIQTILDQDTEDITDGDS